MLVEELAEDPEVKDILVLASYMEFENLGQLISGLLPHMSEKSVLIISDDSGLKNQDRIREIIEQASKDSPVKIFLSMSDTKKGRGSAIRRGFKVGYETFHSAENYLEMDSDGSHRAEDIIRMLAAKKCDFTIGSRYLPESQIEGWPITRKLFSAILNRILPRLFKLPSSDLTNGLRSYSRKSISILLSKPQRHSGFIALTEQALILKEANIFPNELPIKFVNRISGVSSVGFREVIDSLKGVYSLWSSR